MVLGVNTAHDKTLNTLTIFGYTDFKGLLNRTMVKQLFAN